MSEIITPDNMALPFWLLNFDEAVEILIGQQNNRDADIEVLREIIPIAKARYMGNQRRDKNGTARTRDALVENNIGVDTPIPYRTSDLTGVLEEYIGKLELRGELAPYKRIKARIEAVSRDPRYAFMFGSLTVQDNMAQVLARLFRIPVNGKPIAILELGGLPSEIINVVVSVLARLAFDFGVWSAGKVPITFVCEEAHRYVPNDKSTGFEPTKRAISRIAKVNLDPAEYDRIMNVNVRAPFLVVQAMARLMIAKRVHGAVVNIGSGAARQMPTGSVTYCMSKTALERLSKGQALELAPDGIRVNVVEPGFAPGSDFSYLPPDYVERMTARIPLGRTSAPGDAAGMVLYLCSQAASYITGAVVSCDGGNSIGTFQPATNS